MEPTLDPFTQTMMMVLMGSPQLRAALAQKAGNAPSVVPGSADTSQELPGGSFAPQSEPAPDPVLPPSTAAAAPALEQGPLGRMLGLSPETSRFFRGAGAGMSNIRGNPYGDPFITAAQGFGGAQEYAEGQDQAAKAGAIASEQQGYTRNVAEQERQRQARKDAEDSAIKQAAEARAGETSKLANRKTAMEIKRLARQNGITNSEQIAIENAALKAGDNIMDPTERKAAIDAERSRLLERIQAGGGISDASGAISQPYTATNPDTGQTIEWRDGKWVDQETGEAVGQ